MGIYKTSIKFSLILFLSIFFNCKTEKKIKKEEVIEIAEVAIVKKDTTSKYPEYLTKEYVLGKFDYKTNPDFGKIPKDLSSSEMYLRKEVLEQFLNMVNAAEKEGIKLKAVSATRNFPHQKRIWDYKWTDKYKKHSEDKRALKILEYSSMPGTSRHHWGTDVDINDLEDEYFLQGKGKKEYEWLMKHANSFGFYLVYTSKDNGRTGYNEEKWHWSYAPLSSIYLEFYNQNITHQDIAGFQGSQFAKDIDMITNYVNGINPKILTYKP